jgi:hypothetical protein
MYSSLAHVKFDPGENTGGTACFEASVGQNLPVAQTEIATRRGQIVSKKNRTLTGPAEFVDPKVDTPSRGEQLPTLTGRDLGG